MNLVEHLNAEIGIGTVTDILSAKKWLHSTFLRVRLKENPSHYRIDGDRKGRSVDERLEEICSTALSQLLKYELVEDKINLTLTESGEAMARYYVSLPTMVAIVGLSARSKSSEIVRLIYAQAVAVTDSAVAFYSSASSRVSRNSSSSWREKDLQGAQPLPKFALSSQGRHRFASTQSHVDYPIGTWQHRYRIERQRSQITV